MPSIFHFFGDLVAKRDHFLTDAKLEDFPFDDSMLSCRRKGRFPDLAIRINQNKSGNPLLDGGELIELKDSKSYSVASFNSTIPTGAKKIADLVSSGKLADQMTERGDDIHSLPVRQVYYLLRGRRGDNVKVCLLHGSFFETVEVDKLIRSAFKQAMRGAAISSKIKYKQSDFASVRRVDKASVSLRFRIMTEARREANILNNYKAVKDNTLNLILPLHKNSKSELNRINEAATLANIMQPNASLTKIKHPFNGYFWHFSIPLI